MKRLLLVALMVLVTLVGMVGFSRAAADRATQSVTPVIENIQPSLDAISYAVSALQSTTNPTTGAVTELLETVNAGVPVKPKMYYLTWNSFDGGDAIKACDPRFHMASISEIQDPSNLQYVNRSTSVYDSLVDDEGLGPPSNRMGWVRSGVYPPSGFVYDCDDFRDNHDDQLATTLTLNAFWPNAGPGQPVVTPDYVVHAAQHPCSQPEPVWCVEDPE